MEKINNTQKIKEIQKNIELLKESFKEKLIGVNDYCSLYGAYNRQIKSLIEVEFSKPKTGV